jgi:tetratricopeptide (TPR) repeat protein
MLNIHDLEKRWLQYKIKSYIPYIVAVLLLILVSAALYFFVDFQKDEKQENNITTVKEPQDKVQKLPLKKNETANAKKAIIKHDTNKTVIPQATKKSIQEPLLVSPPLENKYSAVQKTSEAQSKRLKPSLKFLRNIHDTQELSKQKIQQKERKRVIQTPKPKEEYMEIPAPVNVHDTQDAIKVHEKEITPEKPLTLKKKDNKVAITIKRKESQDDINDVIKRFQKNNNPALSLFVAKKYYELGNYKEAYNYALATNKINNHIEDSWLIFAKSLVKLGKKERALTILREYIKFSNSANAQVLLDEIQQGKFK